MAPSTLSALPSACDVLVVGGGNAGFCAALSAAEHHARRVILIDKCPEAWSGGNSFFTAGAMRTVHGGLADLLPLVNNIDAATAQLVDLEPYTQDQFLQDLERVTAGRANPELAQRLVGDSNEAIKWLHRRVGVRFQLSLNRQAYRVDGRYKFWGGMALKTQDGGQGLMEDHVAAARRLGVRVVYSAAARRLLTDGANGAVTGVEVEDDAGGRRVVRAGAVVLAAGGFEANPRLRAQYLGPGWDLALVRGTPHNTGDGLEMAMRDVGARQAGHWSGCHSVAWDALAPADRGDRVVSNQFTKSGYPLGLMINSQGLRFVDEGVDLRNYTYAKFGRAILAQPDGIAFQVWDSQATPWLRGEEYRDEVVRKIWAGSIEELAEQCAAAGLHDRDAFVATVHEYNEAVRAHRREHPGMKWDPAIRDGLSTQSKAKKLGLPKTNWALPLDQPPFLAVKVACGVTFTFGGLAVNPDTAAVISTTGREVPGLYCAGEMLGGLFYGNYPGGSGLTSGTVFGRRAGREAAKTAAGLSGVTQRASL